nr:unnamed protein product [Callosobruchus analis]
MESRWYLFPGQTLENTKISDRSHALHITQTEWNKITGHLDRKKLIQEAIDREEAHRRYLDEGSKSMIKNWENSLENIRKRKEEERLRIIEQRKGDRMARFYELRKEQERIRNEYVEKVRHDIYIETGNARQLTGAYVEAEAMYEREKQLELKNKIKQHEIEEEAKWAKKVKEGAEEEVKEKQAKTGKEREKNLEFSKKLLKQIEENAKTQAEEREKQVQNERMDSIKAAREQECLEELEKIERKKKTDHLKQERNKQKEEIGKRKIQTEQEQKELDEVIQIYKEAKFNIDCMKKAREKEVMAIKESNEAAEEAAIRKAIAERDAAEEAKVRAKLEKDERLRQDRLKDRQRFIEKEKQRLKKEEELKKWDMLNRYKVDEITKKYDEQKRKEHWQKILEYRKTLLDQMIQLLLSKCLINEALVKKGRQPARSKNKKRSYDWWENIVNKEFMEKDSLENFRVGKDLFMFIVNELRVSLQPKGNILNSSRTTSSVEKKVAIALFYLASVSEYLVAIEIASYVQQTTILPIISGAIDGTHIPIKPPRQGQRDFINRKEWALVILQAVVDAKYRFKDICVKNP